MCMHIPLHLLRIRARRRQQVGSSDQPNKDHRPRRSSQPSPGSLEGWRFITLTWGSQNATVLVSRTGKVVLFDCGEAHWNSHKHADTVADYPDTLLPKKEIDFVIIFHMHFSVVCLVRFGRFEELITGDISRQATISGFGYKYHDVESHIAGPLPDNAVSSPNTGAPKPTQKTQTSPTTSSSPCHTPKASNTPLRA